MRFAPSVKISDRVYDCAFLCAGYDTLEESASVFVFKETWERLDKAKAYAKERNNGDNQAYTTKLGGLEFQIKPHGGDGVAFILSNDLFTVAIRPAEVDFNLSVTYRSACLWQYGAQDARGMLWGALLKEMKPRPVGPQNENADPIWRKISRVDWAMDFHSPEFTDEISPDMASRIVCHSSVKVRADIKARDEYGDETDVYVMGRSVRTQTLTVGKKDTLQVQIYNKTDEITEKSGKTWMWKLWERAGLESSGGRHFNVWRLEMRFCRQYLADRNIETFEDFDHERERLICEALTTRRLTDRTKDTNRRRWPLHPIWGQAIELSGYRRDFLPLGRMTERASEVIVQEAIRDTEAAFRRIMVIREANSADIWAMFDQIVEGLDKDPRHAEIMEKYRERYKYADHAR
ncbi:MAG: hypothetical protein KKA05_01530 [Alphaproteobacteria bacterium]|nr:hypothetical protein [Alphaproteobacteria bacterium]MBU0859072.1 hypothetical protein [Alphaproteobacteria bacterium]